MEVKFKDKLAARVIFYLLLSAGLVGMAMTAYVEININNRRVSELRLLHIHGRTLSTNGAKNLLFGVLTGNREEIEKGVEPLLQDPLISYVLIYDKECKLLFEKYQGGRTGDLFRFAPPLRAGAEKDGFASSTLASRAGEPLLDFALALRPDPGFGGAEDAPPEGYVRLGMSLGDLSSQIRRSRIMGYAMILCLLVFSLAVGGGVYRRVLPPIGRLVEAARRAGTGDLSARVEVSNHDEIGLLAETFNEMIANIGEKTSRLEEMMEKIAGASDLLAGTSSRLMTVTTQQATGATEQAAIVHEVVSTTEEIAASAAKIAATAGEVDQAVSQTTDAARQGAELIGATTAGMERIQEQVEISSVMIDDLVDRARNIGGVIRIIHEISDQTEVLSLNASIEALGAGVQGRRFAAVADEVRRLALRTTEAANQVKAMIESIQKATDSLARNAENERRDVLAGAELVRKTGDFFQRITEMVESAKAAGTEIDLVTRQQSTATDQMVSSILEVEKVTREVEKGVLEIEGSMGELNVLAERLRSIVSSKERPGLEPGEGN